MTYHGYVLEQSRKSKAAKNLYDHLRHRLRIQPSAPSIMFNEAEGRDGIVVPVNERYRVLNIRIHDEHLSPYFVTDMNLFHMLMIDESVEITLFKADKGWLFIFEGVPTGPKPFGQNGFDTR